ncbi:hypothetical protein [Mycolicibacterium sp. A43C]
MYAPNAPDPRPSNTADYSADDLLGVIASSPHADAILAGAFLDYVREVANWSPPEFEEAEPNHRRRRGGVLYKGTKEWRRLTGLSRGQR